MTKKKISDNPPIVDCLTLAYAAREAVIGGEWTTKGLATLAGCHMLPGLVAWIVEAHAPDRGLLALAIERGLRAAVDVIPPAEEGDSVRTYATITAIGTVRKDPTVYAETALSRAEKDMGGDTAAEGIVSSVRELCDPTDPHPAWLHAFQAAQCVRGLNQSEAFAHTFFVGMLTALARASVLGAEIVPLANLEASE